MALGGALVLTLLVGGYYLLRPGGQKASAPAAGGGPSLEHATMLFRDGKVAETIAELRQIPAEHPDYARAQKLLASLTRKGADGARRVGRSRRLPGRGAQGRGRSSSGGAFAFAPKARRRWRKSATSTR